MPRADQATVDLLTDYFQAMEVKDFDRLGGYYADVADEARSRRHAPAGALEVVSERDQCLRRDASDVQAGAAELAQFDQDDVAAELTRPRRGGVPTGSPAEDENVDRAGDLTGDHQSPSNSRASGASRWRRMASPKLMMSRPSTTR